MINELFTLFLKLFRDPYFYPPAIALILLIEYRYPAIPSQKTINTGFAHDAVWLLVQAALAATLVTGYVTLLRALYHRHLDFLTINAMGRWPLWAKFAVWFLVTDFLQWLHHWVRHKVPWFWQFHTVHHSQKQMSLFTDLRYHAVEYLIAETVMAVPLMVMSANLNSVVGFTFLQRWYTHFYHANVGWNLGPLRYVLVTPQSHRIHHSADPRHRDKNFGVIFSFWDRLFGTQYGRYDEYPETGIVDARFPLERTVSIKSLLLTPIRQHIYPFQAIARDLKKFSSA